MTATLMRYDLPPPQERILEPPQRDSKLEEALQQYHRFCTGAAKNHEVWDPEYTYFFARDRVTAVLNSLEINLFLAEITRRSEHPLVKSYAVTALINNAYETGIHSFDITIPDNLETQSFGEHLCGTKEQPYNLRITGNLGWSSFQKSKHVNVIVKGNCGRATAVRAEYVSLECEDITRQLGVRASNSVFRFHHINYEFISKGNPLSPGILHQARCCKIQVYTQEDFELCKTLRIPERQGHKIQLAKEITHEVIQEVSV